MCRTDMLTECLTPQSGVPHIFRKSIEATSAETVSEANFADILLTLARQERQTPLPDDSENGL